MPFVDLVSCWFRTFWIPTAVTAFVLLYMGIFSIFFRNHFKSAIAAPVKQPTLVFYAAPHTDDGELPSHSSVNDFEDSVFLINDSTLDANASRVTEWESGRRNYFEQRKVAAPPNLTLTEGALAAADENREFSRDSLTVWMGLAFAYFILILPSHILQFIARRYEFQAMETYSLWITIGLCMSMARVTCVDFLVVLLTPRYREMVATNWRRLRR